VKLSGYWRPFARLMHKPMARDYRISLRHGAVGPDDHGRLFARPGNIELDAGAVNMSINVCSGLGSVESPAATDSERIGLGDGDQSFVTGSPADV